MFIMKLRNTAFLIVAGLFFLQLGVAVAASFQEQSHSDASMQMPCHHGDASQQSNTHSELSSQTAEEHSCCKTGCQCGVNNCSSSAMTNYESSEWSHTIATSSHTFYTSLLPQQLQNDLFRPPIFS